MNSILATYNEIRKLNGLRELNEDGTGRGPRKPPKYGFDFSFMKNDFHTLKVLNCKPETIRSLLAANNSDICRIHALITKLKLYGIEVQGWI